MRIPLQRRPALRGSDLGVWAPMPLFAATGALHSCARITLPVGKTEDVVALRQLKPRSSRSNFLVGEEGALRSRAVRRGVGQDAVRPTGVSLLELSYKRWRWGSKDDCWNVYVHVSGGRNSDTG